LTPKIPAHFKGSGFPDRLRKSLDDRHETAAGLARAIAVTPQAVGKWLKGGDIGFEVLQKVANHLGVNWVWLRYGDAALRSLEEQRSQETFGQRRREFVEQVIANEERLSVAINLLDVGVIEEDLLTGKCYWNDPARRHLNAPSEILPSHDSFRALLSDDCKPLVDDFYNRTLLESSERATLLVRPRDALCPKVEIVFQIYRNDRGQPIRLIGVSRCPHFEATKRAE
jgi:PAS domain-containing protein